MPAKRRKHIGTKESARRKRESLRCCSSGSTCSQNPPETNEVKNPRCRFFLRSGREECDRDLKIDWRCVKNSPFFFEGEHSSCRSFAELIEVFHLGSRIFCDVSPLRGKVQHALQALEFAIDRRSFHGLVGFAFYGSCRRSSRYVSTIATVMLSSLWSPKNNFRLIRDGRWPLTVFSESPAKCERSSGPMCSGRAKNELPLTIGIVRTVIATKVEACLRGRVCEVGEPLKQRRDQSHLRPAFPTPAKLTRMRSSLRLPRASGQE